MTYVGKPPVIKKVGTVDGKKKYMSEKKVKFYCCAIGVELKYTWLLNGKQLSEHGENVTITVVKQHTGNDYQCCVSNPFGKVKSAVMKITVGEWLCCGIIHVRQYKCVS